MFSLDEMRELALAFPNSSCRAFPSSEQEARLIPSLSGDGFVRSDIVLQSLHEIIESGRLPLSHLAASFDIAKDELAALVRDPRSEFLLSTDLQNVLSKAESERLQNDLKELVEGRVVYAAGVAIANNLALESINKLISMNRYGAKGEDEDVPRLALYPQTSDPMEVRKAIIFSPSYLEGLVEDAQSAFNKAQESEVPESIPPDGVLPTPFLQLIVDRLGSSFEGRFIITEGTVDFTPKSCLERQRKEMLEGLVDGTVPSCSLQWLVDLMPEQYPDLSSAERYIHANHPEEVLIFFDTAVSKMWHDNATEALLQNLKDESLVNVSDPFQDLSADAARSAAAKAHADILATVREGESGQGGEWVTISEGLFPYLIRVDLFNTIQDTFTARIRDHANHLWTQSSTLPESELTLDVPAVLAPAATSLSLPAPLLPILLRCSCDGGARSTFNATLTQLETDADAALAAFWRDRVALRFELYAAAAAGVPDAKLRAALLDDLLPHYVALDLVPDAVQRAEAKGLVRSARAKRNVRKLVAALQERRPQGAGGADAVRASLAKFAGKLDVASLGEAEREERKEGFVRDMVRGMRKDADAPRLFLTLVVVLWARRAEGVVYATGKYAPKILKLLKGDSGGLEEEVLARLETLKEMVKAGGVGGGEKEEMRKMAAEAWGV
ncbi:Purine biosynthesis protein purh [Neofusicoccum parvum]|uniref:Purine biosynthesis protein purh n=1 Tax=Neofusicoccum parvum TaxID=310453 RepID=A0ACB5S578_9PEZI|nr:Purine biosynthesis protein purh [Neofusicoccum parvum]